MDSSKYLYESCTTQQVETVIISSLLLKMHTSLIALTSATVKIFLSLIIAFNTNLSPALNKNKIYPILQSV